MEAVGAERALPLLSPFRQGRCVGWAVWPGLRRTAPILKGPGLLTQGWWT